MSCRGPTNQAVFHEALNLAALWNLPVVMLCENNIYSEMTPFSNMVKNDDLTSRASAYGIPAVRVDGMELEHVFDAVTEAASRARAGGGPTFIEAKTYRFCGHMPGDTEPYRTKDEVEQWRERDPIQLARNRLVELGTDQATINEVEREATAMVRRAEEQARNAPLPDVDAIGLGSAEWMEGKPMPAVATDQKIRTISYSQALGEALAQEMERDPNVLLLGEDIGVYGGVFKVTAGLLDRFGPERVIETPIAEAGFVGAAIGAALTGKRPVVELMFMDFALVAADQLLNQAAKLRYMSGDQFRVPLTIRTQQGVGRGTAAQHSQCLEALFMHVPGFAVALPSTPADAKGLLTTAIRSDDPCIVIEHKMLYGNKGDVPEAEHTVPFGQAAIRREGNDVTIVSYSRSMQLALGGRRAAGARWGRSRGDRPAHGCASGLEHADELPWGEPGGWSWSTKPTVRRASGPRSQPVSQNVLGVFSGRRCNGCAGWTCLCRSQAPWSSTGCRSPTQS